MEPWALELADDMWMTMLMSKAVGLAANQVGFDYRMITINGPEFQGLMINPTIEERSKEVFHYMEGCLSMPGYQMDTGKRSKTIKVDYFDLAGAKQTIVLGDMTSVIVQHEIEHLEGIVFTDHLNPAFIK
jgi:peptide deformylase